MNVLYSTPRRAGRIAASIAAAAGLLGGCASTLEDPMTGYTCCNLQGAHGFVISSNVQGHTMLPFGMAAKITSLKRSHYAYGTLDGEEWGFTHESGSKAEDTLRWLRRIVVKDDPKPRYDSWPAEVRNAIAAARLVSGMSRDQVAMAIGYPAEHDTPSLDAPLWRYYTRLEDDPLDVHFGADGKIERVMGGAASLRLVMLNR